MPKIYFLLLLIGCSFALHAQECVSLGCADAYTITTDGTQLDQASGPEWGCYYNYPRKQTIWQYFYSPLGGDYTQSFTSAADLDWQVWDMGTSFAALNCPISPSGWTLAGCDISYNPGGPTGPGVESTVTTTAGHYYAVALILWEPLTLTFTFGTPLLGGNNLSAANCLIVLPVTIVNFAAAPQDNNVLLNWQVAQESNVSYYEVQASTDGVNFKAAGKVAATNSNNYNFVHAGAIAAGINYYKLKIVDKDGRAAFSAVVKIKNKTSAGLQVVNNPVVNVINLTGLKNTGEIRVIDLAGKTVLKQPVRSQTLSVDASHLQPGLYIVQYAEGNTTESVKFLKL